MQSDTERPNDLLALLYLEYVHYILVRINLCCLKLTHNFPMKNIKVQFEFERKIPEHKRKSAL